MTDKTPAMPELPEPELGYIETDKSKQPAFSARQMRVALQSVQPAEVSDEEISRLWSWSATAEAERTATTQQHAFAYALLALRPQAVPMTDEQRQQAFNKSWATSTDFFAGIVAAEVHHFGITQRADGGEVA